MMMTRLLLPAAALVAASSAFGSFAFDGSFDSLPTGGYEVLSPDGWVTQRGNGSFDQRPDAQDNVAVVADPTGGTTLFSDNVLSLMGAANVTGNDPMNDWLTNFGVVQPLMNFKIGFDFWTAAGVGTDPSEIFIRFDRWSNYVAIKADAGSIEGAGGGAAAVSIPTETVHHIDLYFDVSGVTGDVTGYKYVLNGTKVLETAGLSTAVNQLEIRSQKVQSYIDNLDIAVVPEPSTIALMGLGALAVFFVLRRRR
jgi:hypothetical protein